MLEVLSTACGRSAQRYPEVRHDEASVAPGAARRKSPSLLIEKNPELMRFGIRHSVALRHSFAAVISRESEICRDQSGIMCRFVCPIC